MLRIENGNLVFESLNGSEVSKALADVQQIAVDSEPAFTAAEAAFRADNHVQATQSYLAALQSSGRAWVRDRSAMRIEQDAGLTHRFDAAVGAYVYLVRHDPAVAVLPGVGDASKEMIAAAAEQLTQAINPPAAKDGTPAPPLPAVQQAALLRLAISVFQAQGSTDKANNALQQIVALHVATPAEAARWALVRGEAALQARDFAGAAAAVQQNRGVFIDPAQQVDALYVLARAADGLLTDRHDATALKDVAIDYMRVVPFGNDLPGAPHVAAALLRVGQIEEELSESAAARDVYRQVVQGFPRDPAAAAAKASLDRLSKPA